MRAVGADFETELVEFNGENNHIHLLVNDLDLPFETFPLGGDAGQFLLTYIAEPASPTRDALDLLASWAATTDAIARPAPADDPEPADAGEPPG